VPRKPIRVLLDANVWRHVADRHAGPRLEQVSRKRDLQILVAPSVVYEALRTRDARLREVLTRLMTMPAWVTLMPEAYEESEEFLSEVRRIRPEWLCVNPNLRKRRMNYVDWVRGPHSFWARIRRDPAQVARHVGALEHDTIDRVRSQARDRRRAALEAKWSFDSIKLAAVVGQLQGPRDGWNGDNVAPWRIDALEWASRSFLHPPYSDWIDGIVDLSQVVGGPSWVRFWLYDVEDRNMPRWWIRCACWILQALRKVTNGTPCDEQLATYAFSCDVFLTCDRAFAEILERCSVDAPRSIGHVRLLPQLGDPGTTLIATLDALRGRHV